MKKDLIAGALGVTGRALVDYLVSLGEWKFIGLSRRSPTDAELLAKAMVWAAENDRCNEEVFNITNGDFNRWENLWPQLAAFFKIEYARPQRIPLAHFMSDNEPVWNALVKEHQLLNYSFHEAVAWPFGEAIFNIDYDVMSDTTKSRRFGFHGWVDTKEMLFRLFAQFQKTRFIPS